MSKTAHVAFFGDMEHRFDLAQPEIVRELEAVAGAGIGAIVGRVIEARTFYRADLEAVIRLGLIGGGLNPQAAARLVAHFLPLMPMAEAQIVAMGVLNALWFGTPEAQP